VLAGSTDVAGPGDAQVPRIGVRREHKLAEGKHPRLGIGIASRLGSVPGVVLDPPTEPRGGRMGLGPFVAPRDQGGQEDHEQGGKGQPTVPEKAGVFGHRPLFGMNPERVLRGDADTAPEPGPFVKYIRPATSTSSPSTPS
jgi:hypothetical protein